MARQQHRFSRRFLTILILATSIAIILLSQNDESEDSMQQQPSNLSQPLNQD